MRFKKNYTLILLSFFILAFVSSYVYWKKSKVYTGKIILLHGISSAGKTTTAKKLQDILDEPYLYFDPDVNPAPARIFGPGSQEGITFEPLVVNEKQILVVKTGSYMAKLGMVMPELLALFASHGFNGIGNFAFGGYDQKLAEKFLKKYVITLHNYTVYFINLTVSPEIAAQREQERGGFKGLAAGQQYSLLKSLIPESYDLEIDTSKLTPDQVAKQIADFINSNKDPQAFKKLYRQI